MNKKILWVGGVLVLMIAFLLRFSPRGGNTDSLIGQPAPHFQLPDLEGRKISLAQYRGKIVMLDFWATWCGPCRRSMPLLEQLQKEYSKDMVLLAINLQEPQDVIRSYIEAHSLRATVLLDEEGTVGGAYHSDSIPMQVIVDQEGIVRHIQIGFTPMLGDRLKAELNKLRKSS